MRGASGRALTAVAKEFDQVLTAAGQDGTTIGRELFSVVDALDGSRALSAVVSDPSLPPGERKKVFASVLPGGYDQRTKDVVASLAEHRWVHARDLADATEQLAVSALLANAEAREVLPEVEQQLFAVSRAFIGETDVRNALTDRNAPGQAKAALVQQLLGKQVDQVTEILASRAASHPRGRRFAASVGWFGDMAAERRDLLVAFVQVSKPLTESQQTRLHTILEGRYGHKVELHIAVVPDVIGGMRIQVGADVLDATILTRLTDVRRSLTG